MTLVRRHRNDIAPWNALLEIENRFNRFFGESLSTSDDPSLSGNAWAPSLDLSESEDAYVIEADIPGISKDDVRLEVQDNVISLKGERKNEKKDENNNGYHRIERRYGSFQRSVQIPGGFKSQGVEAKFENGVLRITLPKPDERKPRVITVSPN